jgi:4-hydroxy-2-oxoheptanedioate aldolase
MMSSLSANLLFLKKYGAIGVKTSFEDEGAHPINVDKLRSITNKVGLDLTVKIGGVEAKTDFNLAIDIGVDGVVAPMVESEFALSKFTSFSKEYTVSKGINIESLQGVQNLDCMLRSDAMDMIDYICIGRVDLVSSLGKPRDYIESPEFLEIVSDTLVQIKNKNKKTCMGGSIDINTYEYIKSLYDKRLIDKVETRYIIFKVNDTFLSNYEDCIINAHQFEHDYMDLLCSIGTMGINEYTNRRDFIKKRLDNY